MTLRLFASVLALAALEPSGCGPATRFTPPAESVNAPELLISAFRLRHLGPGLLEFAQDATGDASPIRQLHLFFPPYGVDRHGNFWGGPVHYSVTGQVIGRILVREGDVLTAFTLDRNYNVYIAGGPGRPLFECPFTGKVTVTEYAAGSYGRSRPTRYIDLGRPCSIPSIAVTGAGNVTVAALYVKRNLRHFVIREFPDGKSGELQPVRVIELGSAPVSDLAGDTQGDIYALIGSRSSSNGASIVEYGPTGKGFHRVGHSDHVLGFALDTRERIFAALATTGSTTIREVDGFQPGTGVRFARLTGRETGFVGASLLGIAAPQ